MPWKNVKEVLLSVAVLALLPGSLQAASFREHPVSREEGARQGSEPRSRNGAHTERVRAVMLPLLQVTDRRMHLDRIQISVIEDQGINAATSGDGRYFVTTGLLRRASDDHLRGVLAHEIAHEDLGHPAKAQLVGAGLSIGAALLEQWFPGSAAIAPVAGALISNQYTRPLELEADRHAVNLLQRAGYSKRTMIDTLAWLMRRTGDSGGALSSHPATSERIQALRSLR